MAAPRGSRDRAGARGPAAPPPADWPEGASLVVLSGGTSQRLGRDKATTHVGGSTLLARVLAGVPAAVPVVVVGPRIADLPDRVTWCREDPPGSGPLAGIGAGVQHTRTATVGVLATDMPFAVGVVAHAMGLLAAAEPGVDAVLPIDPGGRRQPLAGAYRADALRGALARLAPLTGKPVRAVLEHLRVMEWPVAAADLADVDTATDLGAARRRVAREGAGMDTWVAAAREALGIDIAVDLDLVLDVARDAAHGVERPAAPVTTYLLGAAVARGADPAEAARVLSALAASWAAGER